MSDPVSIELNTFRVNNNISIYSISCLSVAANGTDEVELPVSLKGVITGIRIVTDSTDLDLSFRTESGITVPSIKEILKIENINLTHNVMELFIPYITSDNLYMVITNNDGTNATGDFDMELLISRV
jgi:hypothetical protein